METKRLILRAPQAEDAQEYLQLHNSEFVLRYNAMVPITEDRARKNFAQRQDEILLVVHKQTGRVIGEIDIQEDSLRYASLPKNFPTGWAKPTPARGI